MCDIESAGQTNRQRHTGCTGTFLEGFTDGVEDDEAAVAEHRNGHHPSHQLQRQPRTFLADQSDDYIRQTQRSAGFLEDGTYQCAEDDDNTDAGERGCEALADHFRHLGQRDVRQQRQHQRNQHNRQKRVQLLHIIFLIVLRMFSFATSGRSACSSGSPGGLIHSTFVNPASRSVSRSLMRPAISMTGVVPE